MPRSLASGQRVVQEGLASQEVEGLAKPAHHPRDESWPEKPSSVLLLLASSVHVGQLPEAAAPVVQVVVILVPVGAGRLDGAEGAGLRATALVVKHQQGVVGRCCGVRIGRLQVLRKGKGEGQLAICHRGDGTSP